MDTLRPVNLDNIFDKTNVRILVNSNEITSWNLPNYNQIYEEDEEEEEESDEENEENEDEEAGDFDSDDEQSNPNRRNIVQRIERRLNKTKQKENWKRSRKAILWDYYMTSWHSTSVSFYIFLITAILKLGLKLIKFIY